MLSRWLFYDTEISSYTKVRNTTPYDMDKKNLMIAFDDFGGCYDV